MLQEGGVVVSQWLVMMTMIVTTEKKSLQNRLPGTQGMLVLDEGIVYQRLQQMKWLLDRAEELLIILLLIQVRADS